MKIIRKIPYSTYTHVTEKVNEFMQLYSEKPNSVLMSKSAWKSIIDYSPGYPRKGTDRQFMGMEVLLMDDFSEYEIKVGLLL